MLCVWPDAGLLASGGTASSRGGGRDVISDSLEVKDLVVGCVVPRPDTLAFAGAQSGFGIS